MSSRTPLTSPPGPRAQLREHAERVQRDAARSDDRVLVEYEAKWQRKLRRLQQAHPERWRVAGLSDEEVRDILTLRLIEAVRRASPEELALARPGREWGLLIVQRELRALRRCFKLPAVPVDFSETLAVTPELDQEERLLVSEAERLLLAAEQRAEQGLTRPQRQWLAAMKLSARAGGFFQASAEPNLSAASRVLGKNRSSAQRAYRELQARFSRELARTK
ncbi:MAG: hypothetical protein ABUL60_33355 [Myxococcales bacterium]